MGGTSYHAQITTAFHIHQPEYAPRWMNQKTECDLFELHLQRLPIPDDAWALAESKIALTEALDSQIQCAIDKSVS